MVAITDTRGFAIVSARPATVVVGCRMRPCELQSCIGPTPTCESAYSGAASSHVCPSAWCTATERADKSQRSAHNVAAVGNPASTISIAPAIRCLQLTDRVYRELFTRHGSRSQQSRSVAERDCRVIRLDHGALESAGETTLCPAGERNLSIVTVIARRAVRGGFHRPEDVGDRLAAIVVGAVIIRAATVRGLTHQLPPAVRVVI
jgi:hypothetical protein